MNESPLREFIAELVDSLTIPGVAVGVFDGNRETFVCRGVTSIDNPLPVDKSTLFLIGSVTKTFTATALMRLVASGKIDIEAPVSRYLPELTLACEATAVNSTVLTLLNHTTGLDWGLITNTGEGDNALAAYVAKLAELKQIAPFGTRASYSQAGYNIAGRIVEKVTGQSFEHAVSELLFTPLELSNSFFLRDDIMTRRFSVGHNRSDDGTFSIARLWRRSRGDNPGGGIAASVSDLLQWARFHLTNGVSIGGTQILPPEMLRRMRAETIPLRGSNFGSAIGIGWFLGEIDGIRTVGHAGSANGQFAELLLVPECNFAVVALSNASPNGIRFNQSVVRWSLNAYLGLADRDPEPLAYDRRRALEFTGNYENAVMNLSIQDVGSSLELDVRIKPEIRVASDKSLPPDYSASELGLLPSGQDEYILTTGAFRGQRGLFTRDARGFIVGIDLAGRLFNRVTPSPESSAHKSELLD